MRITIKDNPKDFKDILLIFLLLFLSNDTYLFGTNSNELFLTLPRLFLLVFCLTTIVCSIINNKLIYNRRMITLYSLMVFSFMVVSVYHHEVVSRVIVKLLCITTGMLICTRYELKDYAQLFLKCMQFFSIAAIFLTVLAYVAPSVVSSLPSMVNTAGVRFFSIGLAGLDERSLSTWAVRTGGIFWEPGVFQMYLNLAILFELMLYHGKNKKRMAIYILALFFTFSTTGYIAFIWIMMTYSLFGKDDKRLTIRNLCVYILLLVSVFLLYYVVLYTSLGEVVFGKLFDVKDGSTFVRLASVLINIEIIQDNPWTGIGMGIMEIEFWTRSGLSADIPWPTKQNTNTLLYQFAAHGCLFGSLFTWGTYKFGAKLGKNFFMKMSIFIMIVLIYVGENLMTSIFPYIIIFYGVNKSIDTRKSERNAANKI